MATIVQNNATGLAYLLDGGKLVLLHTTQDHRLGVLEVDAASFANLVTAYGSPVGT